MGIISMRTAIASMGEELQTVDPYPLSPVTYLDENNKKVEVSSFKGKVVVLHFWATWCTPCVHEMPRMLELTKSLEDRNFVVLPISLDRDAAAIQRFNDAQKLTMPFWIDPGQRAFISLSLRGVPSTLIIDGEGKVVAMREGPVNWTSADLRSFLWNQIEKSKRADTKEAAMPAPSAPSAMSAPESHKSE